MPMTFDGRARNRYVSFSRDVVLLVRLKGLTLIVPRHYRPPPRRKHHVIAVPSKKIRRLVTFSFRRKNEQHSYKPYSYKSHYEWKGIETSRRGLLIRDNYLSVESPFQEKSAG